RGSRRNGCIMGDHLRDIDLRFSRWVPGGEPGRRRGGPRMRRRAPFTRRTTSGVAAAAAVGTNLVWDVPVVLAHTAPDERPSSLGPIRTFRAQGCPDCGTCRFELRVRGEAGAFRCTPALAYGRGGTLRSGGSSRCCPP